MKVFRYLPEEWVCTAIPAEDGLDVQRRLTFYEKKPARQKWRPIPVELLYSSQRKKYPLKLADFVRSNFGSMVVGARAKAALEGYIGDRGELLPLACEDAELYVLNVTQTVDAMDVARSTLLELEPKTPDTIIATRVAFHEPVVRSEILFRLAQKTDPQTYFTQAFIDEVNKHGLTGFGAKVEWDSMAVS